MKKTITLFMSLAMCFLLASCGGKLIKDAATIAGSGTVVYQSFDSVYEIIEDNSDAFSPRDVARLRSAGDTLSSIKVEICAMVVERGTALKMVADLPELIPLYEKARIAYIEANIIVMSQIDEFERADQMTLCAFQETCTRFDSAIIGALNSGGAGSAQMVKDIVSFVFMVGKIALPLVIL